jgi:hypothetical protein
MDITAAELNRRLSDWIRNRISAEGAIVGGRIFFWRFLGLGLVVFGVGIATGLGLYGYAFVKKSTDNISNLSTAFSKALAAAQLHATAEGTVQIEPREISLAKGQTISLEKNASLGLDPGAKIAVDGDIRVQAAPTISIPRSAPQSSAGVPNITNFTVFKSVPFQKGTVMTGWNFLTSAQTYPTQEYCYYTVNAETPGVGVRIELGTNRKLEAPEALPVDFDVAAAFDNCVWFGSEDR